MAELTIRPEEIRDALDRFVQDYTPETTSREEVGTVVTSGDGIARVEGLPSAMANELLEFENGTLGIALNLDVREIGVVVMGDSLGIEEGQVVKRTGDILSVPVGDGYLGRTVNALGVPIDGLGDITDIDERRPLELQAAGVMDRQGVNQPLQTGIKAIDAMIPIGRGQRQLIIGDRKTGKTAIAIDTIMNQKAAWESGDEEQQVRCIYVAMGQKASTVAALRGALEDGRGTAVHHDRERARLRPGGLQVRRALHRFGHRPALDVPGQARPDHLRRPDQAGRGLPGDVAAAPPASGPRGVPGRCVLPAQPAAGALRQAV